MSCFEASLRTKEAKQAYVRGIVVLLQTGDLNKAWNSMVHEAKRNGSWQAAQFGLIMDFVADLKKSFRL